MPLDVRKTGQASRHPMAEALSEKLKKHLAKIYRVLGLTEDPAISLLLTDDETIAELNAQWRGLDEATDVLSFPAHRAEDFPEQPEHLGDIVISIPYAERLIASRDHHERIAKELEVDARQLQWSLREEVSFLFVHGLLHLVGYDHGSPEEEVQMRAMERRLWQQISDQ